MQEQTQNGLKTDVRLNTINILKENIGSKILDISYSNIFSDASPWARKSKESINKQDYMNLKSFCIKEIISKMKRQPTEWKNIFASDISGKGLISTIYKELIQLNTKKSN